MRGKKLTMTALLGAVAIVLSIFESMVLGGSFFGVPGVKLGLANLAVLLSLRLTDGKTAVFVAVLKSTRAK